MGDRADLPESPPGVLPRRRRHLGTRQAAPDLVQEAFVRAVRRLDSFRGEGPFAGWLWRIVVNVASNNRREPPTVALPEADVPAHTGPVALAQNEAGCRYVAPAWLSPDDAGRVRGRSTSPGAVPGRGPDANAVAHVLPRQHVLRIRPDADPDARAGIALFPFACDRDARVAVG
jgi:hypothetical protein